MAGTEVVVKLMLIVPVVVVGLVLSACGGSSSGSLDTAGPSAIGSMDDQSLNGMVKGSTSSDSAPLSADQADQKAQDRCRELGALPVEAPTMRTEDDLALMAWKMPRILRFTPCVGERSGDTKCGVGEFDYVAFQRASVNGEAEVLRCSLRDDGLFWLRIEAFPGS